MEKKYDPFSGSFCVEGYLVHSHGRPQPVCCAVIHSEKNLLLPRMSRPGKYSA